MKTDEPKVLARARADIEAGRLWKARDRLQGYLATDPTHQKVLAVLARLHTRMRDLPAAGRFWMLTDEIGPEIDQAIAAFWEREGRRPIAVAHALKLRAPIAEYPPRARERLLELQARCRESGWNWDPDWSKERERPNYDSGIALGDIGWYLLIAALVITFVVGLITVVRWLFSLF